MAKNSKKIIEQVLQVRLSQMLINEEYKNGKFKIPIHLGFGHESISVAVSNIMKKNDELILSHRNASYNLARIKKLKPIIDEYLLKSSGLMNSKTGSMNLINPKLGIIYSSSILGNNFSVAVGVSMAQKISNKNNITIVLGGDGSIEEGSFYESLLMLKTLKLSSLIIIENNEWSMSTKINERRHSIDLKKFSNSLGIKYIKMKNNNPFEYIKTLTKLRIQCIKEKTPIVIEVFLSTLGEWKLMTTDFPNGKLINYHAGPTPSVDLEKCQIKIRENIDDPIYVIENEINGKIEDLVKPILKKLKSEIK
jgi:TPP-dependent pyruvate/acetoin dehydrogenase alpha subunit